MATRLERYITQGELWNTSPYAVRGVIALRGEKGEEDTLLNIELTGDCRSDLRGKHIRFSPAEDDSDPDVFRKEDHPRLQLRQIGPTGTITAQGWVRTLPCSPQEYMRRAELGEPLPTEWKRRLYIEWYGQNGRTVIELAAATVEQCTREPESEHDEGDWEPLSNLALPPGLDGSEMPEGPEFIIVESNEAHVGDWNSDAESSLASRPDCDLEIMDQCLRHGQPKPIADLLIGFNDLPPVDIIGEPEVESTLKGLLAQMALLGVALHVCEHFSPRDCYRLLMDRILQEPLIYSELISTGWVQHFMTHEYCSECSRGEMDGKEGEPFSSAE